MNPPGKARALRALDMRRRGMILKDISKKLGVTKTRAHQLARLGEKLERERSSGDVWFELSVRARNALTNGGCGEPTPAGVWRFKQAISLARVPCLGRKAIAEINAWLTKHWQCAICK